MPVADEPYDWEQEEGGWPGFYHWAFEKAMGKPLMVAEYGFDVNTALDGTVLGSERFPLTNAVGLVAEDERCYLCGERFKLNDERAEMFDPHALYATVANMDGTEQDFYEAGDAHLVHAQCGLWRGWEIA